jgi:hypothetical protein
MDCILWTRLHIFCIEMKGDVVSVWVASHGHGCTSFAFELKWDVIGCMCTTTAESIYLARCILENNLTQSNILTR